jgi:uncharacterized lipoprotein YehR (DUF1307 family)
MTNGEKKQKILDELLKALQMAGSEITKLEYEDGYEKQFVAIHYPQENGKMYRCPDAVNVTGDSPMAMIKDVMEKIKC